jgi:anti-sigma factor RsiW
MALNDHDQARIRDYLLGRLSEDEREKVEERLMVEDALFEELEILKGELIEEYREGELRGKERESFEHGFLSSAEGRQRQVFAVAIDTLEQNRQPQAIGLLERISNLFRKPQWAIPIAGLATVLIAGILFVRTPQQPTRFVAITLSSSTVTRSEGELQPVTITIPSDASELKVSLTLPQPATPDNRYRIVLDNRRERTSFQPSGQDANSVSVVIPARQVPPGSYALIIYAIKPDGTEQQIPGTYYFNTQ